MSITVNDIMTLPSLRKAKIVAGKGGAERYIASISVLESVDPNMLKGLFFPSDEFLGSEIVITGFMNCPDNEELQCNLIRCLSEGGEIGIILYYVGVCIPFVSEQVKQLCDELNFVLITMPEGSLEFRYSEVLCEVMEAIIRDRTENAHFVSELLLEVSRLPNHQKSVDTMLKMISDRLHVSLMLCSKERILNSVCWPRGEGKVLKDYLLGGGEVPDKKESPMKLTLDSEYWLYRIPIGSEESRQMDLFVFREQTTLKQDVLEEIQEAIQLVVNIWSERHDQIAVEELIRAILQDEPMKMRSLAQIYQIDVESIHTMWVIENEDGTLASYNFQQQLRELFYPYFKTLVLGTYENCLVAFTEDPYSLREEQQIEKELCRLLEEEQTPVFVVCFDCLQTTVDTANAFIQYQKHLKDVRKIYPQKRIFHAREISFAQTCREMVEKGTVCLETAMEPLYRIQRQSEEADLSYTLEVFLLDGENSYLRTSELMYVHRNTIKYRIGRCSDILRFRVGSMPDTMTLYQAAAIQRLTR